MKFCIQQGNINQVYLEYNNTNILRTYFSENKKNHCFNIPIESVIDSQN